MFLWGGGGAGRIKGLKEVSLNAAQVGGARGFGVQNQDAFQEEFTGGGTGVNAGLIVTEGLRVGLQGLGCVLLPVIYTHMQRTDDERAAGACAQP